MVRYRAQWTGVAVIGSSMYTVTSAGSGNSSNTSQKSQATRLGAPLSFFLSLSSLQLQLTVYSVVYCKVHSPKYCTKVQLLGILVEYFLLLLVHYKSEANIVILLHYNYLKNVNFYIVNNKLRMHRGAAVFKR